MTLFLFLLYIAGIAVCYIASYFITDSGRIEITFKNKKIEERQRLVLASIWPMAGCAFVFAIMTAGFVIIPIYILRLLEFDYELNDLKINPRKDGDQEGCKVKV